MAYRRYSKVKKNFWVNDYKGRYPNRKAYFRYVNNKNEAKEEFMEQVYSNRCIYCGMDLLSVPLSFCEIDHVTSQEDNKALKNDIDNLVCSCRTCNRSKSKKSIAFLPHPDLEEFSNYFTRNVHYEIVPSDCDRKLSEKAIEIMGFDKRQHKITYLYDELKILQDKITDSQTKNKIAKIIDKLNEVRFQEL